MPGVSTGGAFSAAGDLFGGIAGFIGGNASAKGYKKAAKYAHQNAIISEEAGEIKLAQTERQIFKTIGAQQAGYAAAGLTGGGSAQAILRDSLSQGSLEKAIVNAQKMIDVNGYLAQEAQFKAMAKAAKAGGIGSLVGGIASAGAVLFSDARLKDNMVWVGKENGFDIYEYDIGGRRERGVMAYDVGLKTPQALGPVIDGYATVDYGKLGIDYPIAVGG
jgi:hypothetical protein